MRSGVPAAVAHPVAAIVGEAGQGVAGAPPAGQRRPNAAAQLVGQHLVGIELEHVVVAGLGGGEVFLGHVAREGVRHYPRAVLPTDFHGAVGGVRIDHYHLVGHISQRGQAAANVGFLVEGDNDDREREPWA